MSPLQQTQTDCIVEEDFVLVAAEQISESEAISGNDNNVAELEKIMAKLKMDIKISEEVRCSY